METFKNNLASWLSKSNFWILLSMIVLFAFRWVMTILGIGNFSYVYLHEEKWILFFKLIGALILIYSPMMLYSIFRDQLFRPQQSIFNYTIWTIIFVLYPILIGFTNLMVSILPLHMTTEILTFFGLVMAVVEFITNPKSRFNFHANISKLTEKISVEWVVVVLFLYLSISTTLGIYRTNNVMDTSFITILLSNLALSVVFYVFYLINHYFLVEKIYRTKGVVYYLFSFLALVMLFFIPVALCYYNLPGLESVLRLRNGSEWIGENPPSFFYSIFLGSITRIMFLTIPLIILIQWLKQSHKITSLQKEQSETELDLLKQQINPHFFFNTLNNVYSMSLNNDERTSEGILQLSDLMRYVIYKGQESTVTMEEELKYIEDYLELQKMRIHGNFDLQFSNSIGNPNQRVTPLLFIILIENAFKHGIEDAEKDSFLHIDLTEKDGRIQLLCTNSFEDSKSSKTPGLGLKNLNKRLSLIYPDKHTLAVTKSNNEYKVELTIDTDQ